MTESAASAGQAPFQHQARVRTLVVDLMADYFDLLRDWAQRSRTAVERWPNLDCDDDRQQQARERVRRERDAA